MPIFMYLTYINIDMLLVYYNYIKKKPPFFLFFSFSILVKNAVIICSVKLKNVVTVFNLP